MPNFRSKGPRIIVDFTDELARQLSAPVVREVIREVLREEASLDAKAAAAFLALSEPEFRRRAKRNIPVIKYGERSTRYTLKDLIAYREMRTVYPRIPAASILPSSPAADLLSPDLGEISKKLSKNGKMYPTKYRKSFR